MSYFGFGNLRRHSDPLKSSGRGRSFRSAESWAGLLGHRLAGIPERPLDEAKEERDGGD